MSSFLKPVPGGVQLFIRLQPRASKNEIAGLHGDRLKVRLMAPPVDSKANEALCRFLAEKLQVSKGAVQITAGEKSREKTVLVQGLSAEQAAGLLQG